MKKRTLALRLVAGALIFSLSITAISPLGNTGSVQANADTSYSPESDFTFDASSGCITAYQGSDQKVTIPDTINGVSVKGIEWDAFSGNTVLTRITLPDTVVSIGSMAFEGCSGLTGKNSVGCNRNRTLHLLRLQQSYDCRAAQYRHTDHAGSI